MATALKPEKNPLTCNSPYPRDHFSISPRKFHHLTIKSISPDASASGEIQSCLVDFIISKFSPVETS